jgi:GNAT superfamily N-acetyltransferase
VKGLLIRGYEDRDEAAVLDAVRSLQAHESMFHDRMKSPSGIGPWYTDMLKEKAKLHAGSIFVAEYDGKVVGYATLWRDMTSDDEPDEVNYVYAQVGDLAVLPDYRGRGIGQMLLAECEKHARLAGRNWLRIGVLAGNNGAHRLYRNGGFADKIVILEKTLE